MSTLPQIRDALMTHNAVSKPRGHLLALVHVLQGTQHNGRYRLIRLNCDELGIPDPQSELEILPASPLGTIEAEIGIAIDALEAAADNEQT